MPFPHLFIITTFYILLPSKCLTYHCNIVKKSPFLGAGRVWACIHTFVYTLSRLSGGQRPTSVVNRVSLWDLRSPEVSCLHLLSSESTSANTSSCVEAGKRMAVSKLTQQHFNPREIPSTLQVCD